MEKSSIFKVKLLALTFVLAGIVIGVKAEEYTILFLNTPRIKIGEKWLKQGDSFDNKDIIYWTNNDKQMMKVKDGNGKVYKLSRRGFLAYEKNSTSIKSLSDFLLHEQYLGTRGDESKKYYTEQEFYLVDTLHFQTFNERKIDNMITEAVWMKGDKKIITPIERTADGKYYVISLEVYKDEQPCDMRLGIRERNDALNWVNNIYQDIPIIFIPKSIE